MSGEGSGKSCVSRKQNGLEKKKGILAASFGTSCTDALISCIESCENRIRESYSDYEVRRAFTSGIVINKLKDSYGIKIDSADAALQKMKEEGFEEVIVQSLHIIPGIEYEDIKAVVGRYANKRAFKKIVLGKPALFSNDDYKTAIAAMKEQLPMLSSNHAVLFMAHGTSHFADACYCRLQLMLQYDKFDNIYIGAAEGYPSIRNIIPVLKSRGIREVILMPFMLVAGDHAINDMAGGRSGSWSSILKSEGFIVSAYMHGLGENTVFQNIYVKHVKDCIDEIAVGLLQK